MSQAEVKRLKAPDKLEVCELVIQAFRDYHFVETDSLKRLDRTSEWWYCCNQLQ